MYRRFILLFTLSVFFSDIATAQTNTTKNFEQNPSLITELPFDSTFKSLKWRNIGPFRGGRANAVSGVLKQPNVFYAGYTGGGVW
ncbi:MAG: hypothetical protein ABR502_11235, partial [Chitinophagaceae bacterium]